MAEVLNDTIGLTRVQRRRFEKLTDEVDRVTNGDRLFFERHTDRSYRLRIASRPEVEVMELAQGPDHPRLWVGWRWYVLVKQIAPGVRVRLYLHNLDGEETELPEAALAAIYAQRAKGGAQSVEATLRKALEGSARA